VLAKVKYADAKRQLRRCAMHEAGHLVVAFCESVGIRRASIVPDADFAGRCWFDSFHDAPTAVRISYGGIEAESIYATARGYVAHAASRRHDLNDIRSIAAQAGFDHHDLAILQSEARQIVLDNFAAVEAVALELRCFKELNGPHIERVICNSLDY
jgi:hypothetical protein